MTGAAARLQRWRSLSEIEWRGALIAPTESPVPITPGQDSRALLKESALFTEVPEAEIERIAARLEVMDVAAGTVVIREGEKGDACYFIASGEMGVESRDLIGAPAILATFGRGACVGEVALVTDSVRTATVRAASPTRLLCLRKQDFISLQSLCPMFAARVRHRVALLTVDSFLEKSSPFAHLSAETLWNLADQFEQVRFRAGQTILKEGEPGDLFYLVCSGRVEVTRGNQSLQVLEAGDCFGEIALLTGSGRTATVRALEDVALLSLDKAHFDALIQQDPAVRAQFREFVRIRGSEASASALGGETRWRSSLPLPDWRQERRSWRFLLAGVASFALLSVLAVWTGSDPAIYGALVVGSFVAPIVYVTFLAESHLLPDQPARLALTFVLAAGVGLPLAFAIERILGARAGALGSALVVAMIEELVKVAGVAWLFRRPSSRFRMDGVVYGAAAGMGFAAFETVVYGLRSVGVVSALISTLWLRALLAPFAHGTWTALVCAAIWRGQGRSRLLSPRVAGTFAVVVVLHGLWNWEPLPGSLALSWFLLLGIIGLELLRRSVAQARREELEALVALNPEVMDEGFGTVQVECRACGQLSPPGTHYCARCGVALRATD